MKMYRQIQWYKYIPSFIFSNHIILLRVIMNLEPIPGTLGVRQD